MHMIIVCRWDSRATYVYIISACQIGHAHPIRMSAHNKIQIELLLSCLAADSRMRHDYSRFQGPRVYIIYLAVRAPNQSGLTSKLELLFSNTSDMQDMMWGEPDLAA